MKIQAHDLSMQTEHTFSQSSFETFRSFTSFINPQQSLQAPQEVSQTKDQEPSIFELYSSINSIIQRLMSMLSKRGEETDAETRASFHQRYQEKESFSMSSVGTIKTDKGELNIDLNFSMSRSFVLESKLDIYSAFDPLIINLEGDLPTLSSNTFFFDLDNDGEKEHISKPSKGSGFLALDKNDDGEINQGSELFGTLSGNGFGELAQYDKDHNDWIDESDSIFDKLRIWFSDDESKEKELVGLGEVGIGAIYLNAASSEFSFKTQSNQILGELKSCSFFLNEDGSCGNISQIDLAKREEPLAALLQA